MKAIHKRLLGTWISDKRKTLQSCHFYHVASPKKKRLISGLFGKLQLRYTPKFVTWELDGFKVRESYRILGETSESVVIQVAVEGQKRLLDPIILEAIEEFIEPPIYHINFAPYRNREYYWIGLGAGCEWFRKIPPRR